MSTSRTPGPDVPEEKKKGLSKVMSRVKSALHRGDSKKLKPAPAAASSKAAGSSASKSAPVTKEAPLSLQHTPPDQEKARKLAEKYDIDLGPLDWKPTSVAERVEKPIRMRIHRTCHSCEAAFGPNKVCSSCQHVRCEQCPRYPRKKVLRDKGKGVQVPEGRKAIVASANSDAEGFKRSQKYVLTMPSKTGGEDRVKKKPMQRVRRTCHLCNTVYQAGIKTCSQCAHIRCSDCPRDPPKPSKYPNGYPGDARPPDVKSESPRTRVYKKKTRVVRYYCHTCDNAFKAGEQRCSSCGHMKCADCRRVPAKKIKPEPDPDVVRRVMERLEAMTISSSSAKPPPEG